MFLRLVFYSIGTLVLVAIYSHQRTIGNQVGDSSALSPGTRIPGRDEFVIKNERSRTGSFAALNEKVSADFPSRNITLVEMVGIPKTLKPCFQAEKDDPCGGRVSQTEYPGGMHCAPGFCCSKTVIVSGSIGNWCVKPWAYCSSTVVYDKNYSYGTCKCSKYSKNCPSNTTCTDTNLGPYCACNNGYFEVNGLCETTTTTTSTTTTTTTATTTTTTTTTKETAECRPDDCRPGFCDSVRGKVLCTCMGGYVARRHTDIRERCVYLD